MIWLYISIGVVSLLSIFLVLLFVVYYYTFYSPLKGQENDYSLTSKTLRFTTQDKIFPMIDYVRALPYEDAFITSYDKKKLHARVYKNDKSETVVIMAHGYRGTSYRDFSGGLKEMIDLGFNVILIDHRGHGQSKGHSITFGVREKRDIASWISYAKQEFGEEKRIVLVGISMGGASVLFASDLLTEKDRVIADCPYSTPKEVICETLKSTLKMNPKIFYPIANLASIIFGHTNLNKDDANEHVKKSKAKIMILHGEDDTIVPYKFSYRIYEDNKDKVRYELFPNTEHGISYITDTERYRRITKDFLK